MEKQQEQRRKRLVLVPYPLTGHINPMLDLASVLHSKNFSITIAHTDLNPPNPASYPDFTFLLISDGISNWDVSPSSLVDLASAVNRNCKKPFKGLLSQMIQQQEQHDQVVYIIYDFLMHFAETVANELNLPSIILRTSNASASLAYCTIPQLRAQGLDFNLQVADSTSNDLVPGLHPLRFKDLPISSMGNLDNFAQLLAVACNSRTSSAIILNTMDFLENSSLARLQEHYHIPFFHVGPLHKMALAKSSSSIKDETNCMEWLDKQAPNSVLYVSLGSIATMNEEELPEMAWGLASSDQPFLWVIRPGTVGGLEELLPEGFHELAGERACIVKWAPQKDVLAHPAVGAFLSHCGWNSTLESISEGVPMICKPCFVDQTVNARYATHEWGIGIELENFMQRTEIAKAVRQILVHKEGTEMRQKATSIKKEVKQCMEEGGSTYNSLNKLAQFLSSL